MRKDSTQLRGWTKPEIKRLGKIADVAGGTGKQIQKGASNKS